MIQQVVNAIPWLSLFTSVGEFYEPGTLRVARFDQRAREHAALAGPLDELLDVLRGAEIVVAAFVGGLP